MNAIILIIVLLGRNPIHADYSALTVKTKSSHKAPKLKVGDRVRITKCMKIFLAKLVKRIDQKNIFNKFCVKS